ncbi:hypothetical protein DYB30_008036 [Aphanomyces astaci]|uniref:Uncharacterized protein n=1 Tax=Aphanomyces astaci TaxID=112090 RepID=A0A397ECY7_APHAT|nr:hypothetical protein DYB36_007942 [Aphanomyces astaci]RHY79348.1 hypothetical protein DYB30_008036 [Aphanomyces astaci]
MDAKLHTIDATLRRVCRRLDALEEEVQSLPIKFIRCFQEDTSGLRSAMEMLTESLAGKNTAVVTEQQHDASPIAIVNASSSFKQSTTPTATPPSSAGITTTSNKEHVTVAAATVHPSSSMSTLKHTSPARAQSSWSTEEEDPEWMFPSTTCRVLWNGWFHGDNHVGPYSTLRDSLSDQQSKHRFDRATLVMQTLIQMAIDLGLAVSEAALASLPRRDLPIVFDQVFRHLIQQTHDGSLARPGFEVLTYNTAVQLNYLAVAKILQRCPVTTPSRSPTPLPSSSFSEAKPSANNPQAENPNHSVPNSFLIQLASTMPAKASRWSIQPPTPPAAPTTSSASTSFLRTSTTTPTTTPMASTSTTTSTTWLYPLVTCRELWQFWFRGDPSAPASMPALRHVMTSSIRDKPSKRRCSCARTVMSRLETAALEFTSVDHLDAMPREDLDAAFTRALRLVVMGGDSDQSSNGETAAAFPTGSKDPMLAEWGSLTYLTLSKRLFGPRGWLSRGDSNATGYDTTTAGGGDSDDVDDERTPRRRPAPSPSSSATSSSAAWEMPMLTVRDMWSCYFHGAYVPPFVGPVRHVTSVKGSTQQKTFSVAKRMVKQVAAVAVAHGLVESEDAVAALTETDSLAVFDRSFALFLGAQDDGSVTRPGFEDKQMAHLVLLKCCTVDKRLRVANLKHKQLQQQPATVVAQGHQPTDPAPDMKTGAPPPMADAKHCRRFTWANGKRRAVPEGWEFPRTSSQVLWKLWFRGDHEEGIGPFRHLTPHDFGPEDTVSERRLVSARHVMDALIGIADTYMFVESGVSSLHLMSEDDVMVVFDRAFDVLMYNNPDGNVAGYGSNQIQPDYAQECLYTTVARVLAPANASKRKRADAADDDKPTKSHPKV